MAIYVYALLKPPIAPLRLPPGIAQPVTLVGNENLVALVEPDLTLEDWQQDDQRLLQAVLAHDRVVLALFHQVTVLPLRFGIQFGSLQGLISYLDTHQTRHLAILQGFVGKAEYGLKLLPREVPAARTLPDLQGKAYFLAKKQQYQVQQQQQQQQQQEWDWLLGTLKQTYAQFAEIPTSEGKRLSLLVDQALSAQLYQDVLTWQQQCCNWHLSLSEPLPPYHFMGGED